MVVEVATIWEVSVGSKCAQELRFRELQEFFIKINLLNFFHVFSLNFVCAQAVEVS